MLMTEFIIFRMATDYMHNSLTKLSSPPEKLLEPTTSKSSSVSDEVHFQ